MESEFNFVVAPPQDRFCPVCTELLTEPFLSDCGHHVCRECHKRIMATRKTKCPTCQEPNVLKTARLNKHLQREIYDLKVRCKHHVPEASLPALPFDTHTTAALPSTGTTAAPPPPTGTCTTATLPPLRRVGCQWVGELRDLIDHLDPVKRKCEYLLLPCSFGCGQQVRRHAMKQHKLYECLKRDHTCVYCSYHDSHDIVTKQHIPVCHEFPVKCPNKCKVGGLKRKQLKAHIDECPLQEIECPFSSAGCTVKLPRNQMETHEDTAIRQHLRLVLQLNLKQKPSASTSTAVCPQYLHKLPPVAFTVTDFQRKKLLGNRVWTSPPYYTHIGGYKFCLKVYPNGDGSGKGTHISVYARLMEGEHDDELEWPFEGSTTVELLNQRDDKAHYSKTLNLNRYSDDDGTRTSRVVVKETAAHGYSRILNFNRYSDDGGTRTSRVFVKETAARGYGSTLFISHTDLSYDPTTNTEYLQDDCLRLRVSDVVVYSTALLHKTPSWQNPFATNQSVDEFTLTEFTLTEFPKRRQFNNQYYSQPFHTHLLGYKLCLQVDANGQGSGKNTHVSICATLMRGEHDQHLQWPFTGDIIFELLNWRENKGHHKKTLYINSGHGYVRVRYGKSECYHQFISHSSLPYNSTTNTEYFQDGCLRLRVSVANISTR